MKIAVDVMGGDLGPEPLIEGAILAAKKQIEIILVGKKEIIKEKLNKHPHKNLPIFIQDAPEEVKMDESPSKVIRNKKNSSMAVAFELVKKGNANAFISAGNTGAAMAYGMMILKRIINIQRPAIAVTLPAKYGEITLLDVGSNVDCKPYHLFQFGVMGTLFHETILDIKNPSVALLSNGEEENKGNDIIREAHELFKKSSLNYVGFKEGKDVFEGKVNVFVCDGFIGNICLKLSESLGYNILKILKEEVENSVLGKLGALLLKKSLKKIKQKLDYREYGSAPLLGLNGIAFICHGSSDKIAIYNGIKNAVKFSKTNFIKKLSNQINEYIDIDKKKFWKNIKEKIKLHN